MVTLMHYQLTLRLTSGVFSWYADFYIVCFNGDTLGNLQDWFWQQNSERVPFFWAQTAARIERKAYLVWKAKEKFKQKDKKHQKEMGYRMQSDCIFDKKN